MSKDTFSRASAVEPRRPLAHDFTAHTMQAIEQRGARTRRGLFGSFASVKQGWHYMKKVTRTSFVAGFALLLIGGTGMAANAWFKPDVKLDSASGITTLANGDKRFSIDFASCPGQDGSLSGKQYYEMSATSKTSITQLVEGLIASCESDQLKDFFPQAHSTVPKGQTPSFKPYQDQYFFPYAQVEGVGNNELVLATGLNGQKFSHVHVPVDAKAKMFEKGHAISLKDIRPGAWLTLVVHTHSLAKPFNTESTPVAEINAMTKDGMPLGASIAGAVEHVYNPDDAMKIYETNGTDWTRLTRDKSSPDGWKQISPLRPADSQSKN